MRRRGRRRRTARVTIAAVAAAVLIWTGGLVWFAAELPREVADSARATDGVVVLTGGSDRLAAGLDVLAAGKAGKLFVTGAHRRTSVTRLQRLQRREAGMFECCVVLGKAAANTAGNASETARWAAGEGYRSLRVVTGAYHMPRSLLEFRRAMPEAILVAHPVFPAHVKLSRWWRWPGTASLVATEYNKYLMSLAWIRIVDGPWGGRRDGTGSGA